MFEIWPGYLIVVPFWYTLMSSPLLILGPSVWEDVNKKKKFVGILVNKEMERRKLERNRKLHKSRLQEYKQCLMPNCKNDSKNAPNKLFVLVTPRKIDMWNSVLKSPKLSSCSNTSFCCEDHFDIIDDTKNYFEHRTALNRGAYIPLLRLKPFVVPHKCLYLTNDSSPEKDPPHQKIELTQNATKDVYEILQEEEEETINVISQENSEISDAFESNRIMQHTSEDVNSKASTRSKFVSPFSTLSKSVLFAVSPLISGIYLDENHDYDRIIEILGVNINENDVQEQIASIFYKLQRSIFALEKLRQTISCTAALTAYHSFVSSVISDGIIFWGNTESMPSVFKEQRECVTLITKAECGREHFRALDILPLPCLYIKEICVFVSSHPQFEELMTIGKRLNTKKLQEAVFQKTVSKKNFSYMGMLLYNKLPNDIKQLSGEEFENKLTKWLLQYCFYNITEFLDHDPVLFCSDQPF